MIPTFMVVKYFGLIDSYWSMIMPVAINAFNLIIMRNFFQALPEGLEESAKIDGSNDFGVFFKIMLPLAMPSIATLSLFYGVAYWNTYISAVLYMTDSTKYLFKSCCAKLLSSPAGCREIMLLLILSHLLKPSKWRLS